MRETNPISMEKRINKLEHSVSTDDYEDLTNKPKIENVDLIGNLSFEDLGIASATDLAQTNVDLLDLKDLLKPTQYLNTDLVFNNCTFVSGGYIKIGNIVILNMRITAGDGANSISNMPKYLNMASSNIVLVNTFNATAYNDKTSSALIRRDGDLVLDRVISGNSYFLQTVYICDNEE